MDLRTLKIFKDIVELGGYSKSAKTNFVTQSAVSQQIQNLEDELGIKLFYRNKSKIVLTDQGKIVFQYSKKFLKDLENLKNDIQSFTKKIKGKVKVGAIYSIGLYVIQPFISRFFALYPDIKLEIKYMYSDAIYEDVYNSTIDIGLVAYPKKHRGVKIIPFFEDKMVVIMNPKHSFSKLKNINPEDIDGQRFIAFQKNLPTRNAVDSILKNNKVHVNIIQEFDNIDTIKRAVEIGLGISIVPSETVKEELACKSIVSICFDKGQNKRNLGIIIRKDEQSMAVKAFLKVLKEVDSIK